MIGLIHAPSTTARLTAALDAAPVHLRPVLLAVRDQRVGLLIASQGCGTFTIPEDTTRRAAVVIIGDDMERSMGPEGFHMPSIRRVIRACRSFAVVSSDPNPNLYAAMSSIAASGSHAMIIETRLDHEFQWARLVQKLVPGRPLTISSVQGGQA